MDPNRVAAFRNQSNRRNAHFLLDKTRSSSKRLNDCSSETQASKPGRLTLTDGKSCLING